MSILSRAPLWAIRGVTATVAVLSVVFAVSVPAHSDASFKKSIEGQLEGFFAQVGFEILTKDGRAELAVRDVVATHVTYDRNLGILSEEEASVALRRLDTSSDPDSIQQVGDYECLVEEGEVDGLHPIAVYALDVESSSSYTSYLVHAYWMPHARELNGVQTAQYEMCATGGGTSWNSWRQVFNGVTLWAQGRRPENYRIGSSWGQGRTEGGAVQASLGFEVPVRSATINGGVTVQPSTDNYSGSVGPEPRMIIKWDFPPPVDLLETNRVNAFYEAPANWPWDGSPDFQGNVANALYEYSLLTDNLYPAMAIGVLLHCGSLTGCDGP